MTFVSFTRRHVDRSNTSGFQFEFWCDLCNTSHMSPFVYDPMGVASQLVMAASWLFKRGYNVGRASEQINQLARGKAWDEAYAAAVEEAKLLFKQCPRCSRWVCPHNCWNDDTQLCRGCAPNLAAEAVAMKAQAGKIQMFSKALATDQTEGRDMADIQLVACVHCGRRNPAAKFCVDCGKQMIIEVTCKACDSTWPHHKGYTYCPTCGAYAANAQKTHTGAKNTAKAESTDSKVDTSHSTMSNQEQRQSASRATAKAAKISTPAKPAKATTKSAPAKPAKATAKSAPAKPAKATAKSAPAKPAKATAKSAPAKPAKATAKSAPASKSPKRRTDAKPPSKPAKKKSDSR